MDCEGCCRPNGIIETLLAELQQLPLYAVLAQTARPCGATPSANGTAIGNGSGVQEESQLQTLDSRHSDSAGTNLHSEYRMPVRRPDDSSSNGAADTAVPDGTARQGDSLWVESLCMLMLMVPTAAWHHIADTQVHLCFCPATQIVQEVWIRSKCCACLCRLHVTRSRQMFLASWFPQVQSEMAALLDLRTSSVVRAELSYLQNQLQAIDELEHGALKSTERTRCSACAVAACAAAASQ